MRVRLCAMCSRAGEWSHEYCIYRVCVCVDASSGGHAISIMTSVLFPVFGSVTSLGRLRAILSVKTLLSGLHSQHSGSC